MNALALTGKTQKHVVWNDYLGSYLHPNTLEPFLKLKKAAQKESIQIKIVSCFRSYEKQLAIWNRKLLGKSPVYNKNFQTISIPTLKEEDALYTLLTWIALPGASRHHWGTEFDIIDAAALSPNDKFYLLPNEFSENGIFSRLGKWLKKNSSQYGFYFPYDENSKGGIHHEPWHISHKETSTSFARLMQLDILKTCISEAEIMLKDLIIEKIETIFATYVYPYIQY